MKVRITGSCLYWSEVESVGSLYSCMPNFEQWINMRGNYEISTSLVFLNLMKSNNILQTQRFFIQTEYREIIVKKLTVHYLFTHTGMQIWIWYCFLGQTKANLRDSTLKSFMNGIVGVCLTWFDCITNFFWIFCKWCIFGSNCGANWTLPAQWNSFFFFKTGWQCTECIEHKA